MSNRFSTIRAIAAAAICASTGHALAADQVFNFTYSDALTTATGSVTASDNGNGSFTAYTGTLLISGSSFDGLYSLWLNPAAPATAYSPRNVFIIDNQVFPSGPSLFNQYGLLFTSPTREVNVWGNGAGVPWSLWSSTGSGYDYSNDQGAVTYESNPVPAPAGAIALAGLGMFFMRRAR